MSVRCGLDFSWASGSGFFKTSFRMAKTLTASYCLIFSVVDIRIICKSWRVYWIFCHARYFFVLEFDNLIQPFIHQFELLWKFWAGVLFCNVFSSFLQEPVLKLRDLLEIFCFVLFVQLCLFFQPPTVLLELSRLASICLCLELELFYISSILISLLSYRSKQLILLSLFRLSIL